MASLTQADIVTPADEISADTAARAALLALRCEFAALYLGLMTGTIGPAHYMPVDV